jgi:hypothetical protein
LTANILSFRVVFSFCQFKHFRLVNRTQSSSSASLTPSMGAFASCVWFNFDIGDEFPQINLFEDCFSLMANILSFKVVFSFCQFKRFRPVLMTALAMIIGMLPMAIEPG